MVGTGVPSLDEVLREGYPERSNVLVVGPPGIGKEALGYWFIQSGLERGEYCLYVTHRPVADILKNMEAYGVHTDVRPEWIASSGSQKKCDLNDLASISFSIKQAVLQNKQRQVRIATDVLSPLLILNPIESMYRYLTQLLGGAQAIRRRLPGLGGGRYASGKRHNLDGAAIRLRHRV